MPSANLFDLPIIPFRLPASRNVPSCSECRGSLATSLSGARILIIFMHLCLWNRRPDESNTVQPNYFQVAAYGTLLLATCPAQKWLWHASESILEDVLVKNLSPSAKTSFDASPYQHDASCHWSSPAWWPPRQQRFDTATSWRLQNTQWVEKLWKDFWFANRYWYQNFLAKLSSASQVRKAHALMDQGHHFLVSQCIPSFLAFLEVFA